MGPNVSTSLAHTNVTVLLVTTVMPTTASVLHRKCVVLMTMSADQMKSVSSQESASVLHLSTQIPRTTTSVKVHAKGSLVASMRSVLQVIPLSACVKMVLREILCRDAVTSTSVLTILARMVLTV